MSSGKPPSPGAWLNWDNGHGQMSKLGETPRKHRQLSEIGDWNHLTPQCAAQVTLESLSTRL